MTCILNPPALPSPRIGGAPKVTADPPRTSRNFALISPIIASAGRDFRSSNGLRMT